MAFCLLYGPALIQVITGKNIALTTWTFVSRTMSLLFNTLSRFVITFLPKSNHLLISWLQSPSTVILEPEKKKSVTISTFSPSICTLLFHIHQEALKFLFTLCHKSSVFLFLQFNTDYMATLGYILGLILYLIIKNNLKQCNRELDI